MSELNLDDIGNCYCEELTESDSKCPRCEVEGVVAENAKLRDALKVVTDELEYQYDHANAEDSETERVRQNLVRIARKALATYDDSKRQP